MVTLIGKPATCTLRRSGRGSELRLRGMKVILPSTRCWASVMSVMVDRLQPRDDGSSTYVGPGAIKISDHDDGCAGVHDFSRVHQPGKSRSADRRNTFASATFFRRDASTRVDGIDAGRAAASSSRRAPAFSCAGLVRCACLSLAASRGPPRHPPGAASSRCLRPAFVRAAPRTAIVIGGAQLRLAAATWRRLGLGACLADSSAPVYAANCAWAYARSASTRLIAIECRWCQDGRAMRP